MIISFISKNTKVLTDNWNGLNFVGYQASQANIAEVGLGQSINKTSYDLVYCVGDAKINRSKYDSFVIYQGHQGNTNALKADLILPGSAYTEKDATFINLEGVSKKRKKC